jgi:antitoxin MazE
MLIELRTKSQITLPADIVKKLNLKPGDKIEVETIDDKIVLKPVVMIPKEQAYFWTKEWQLGEHEATKEISKGKTKKFDSVDDLMADLNDD